MKLFILSINIITCLVVSQISQASELELLVEMLHDNGTVTDAQYQRLQTELNANQIKLPISTKVDKPDKFKLQEDEVQLKLSSGGLDVNSADKQFKLHLGGRLQLDAAWYAEDGSALGDGTKIRRARLYIKGIMYRDWFYKLEYDFASSKIMDAWLGYNGFEHISLKAGHFRDPFMLQDQISDNNTFFTERASIDAFTAGRHLGLMATSNHSQWTAAAGVFGASATNTGAEKDEDWGVAGRITVAPINSETKLIHLGAAIDYRNTQQDNNVRFKQQPETNIAGIAYVDTGEIPAVNNVLKFGAEFAAVYNSAYLQAEYIYTQIDRDLADLNFSGWYTQTGYFLTGESRRYKNGKFLGVKPQTSVTAGGLGAWELGVRYSQLDLNNHEIFGGEMHNFTAGVNWFPIPKLRISANYIKVLELKHGTHAGEKPDITQVRAQWAF